MATDGVPQYGDGHSPDSWNSDLSDHGNRDGQGEHFTADEEIGLPIESGSSLKSDAMHRYSDLDSATWSQHHTLGPGHNQSSPGDHKHDGGTSKLISSSAAVAAIAAVLGQWVDITPGSGTGGLWLTNSGAAPSVGSGKLWAKYLKIGTSVWYRLGITMGTGATFGTDFWKFPLPFTAVIPPSPSNIQSAELGSVLGQQGGVNNYTGVASLINSTNLIISSHLNANPWGPTVPFTWTASSGNFFGFSINYESTS